MSHSINKICVHIIWATKYRRPLIRPDKEHLIHRYLIQQFKDQGCSVIALNGMPDHIHCLVLLNPQKSLSKIVKQVKGSSSYYINHQNLSSEKFSWQTGYAAFSVSESSIQIVKAYVLNQKAHHHKKSFSDEYEGFLRVHGFDNSVTKDGARF